MQLCFKPRENRPRLRVLVVDDYPDAADVSCMLLTIYGHECRAARSGQEALEVADEFIPEVVILDIGMPDISGYDVARELRARANAQGRRLHLVALTGWGQPADRTRAFDAGFDQHVIKPADAAKLKQIIRIAETGGCERAAITADVHA